MKRNDDEITLEEFLKSEATRQTQRLVSLVQFVKQFDSLKSSEVHITEIICVIKKYLHQIHQPYRTCSVVRKHILLKPLD